jgi:DNA polymerase (family 10)
MKNRQVARILYEIADLLDLEGVAFKPRAYRRAAQAVESLVEPIEEIAAAGRLEELPGVGEAIAKKIAEIAETGHLAYHDELKAELPIDLVRLTQVEGVGPKTAKLLYDALGVRTLDDLERAARDGKVREVKGLGAKTEERIRRGVAEARGVEHRERLGLALPLARGLCARLMATGHFARLEPVGSLRRGRETVGEPRPPRGLRRAWGGERGVRGSSRR